jgi:hypothetical protein
LPTLSLTVPDPVPRRQKAAVAVPQELLTARIYSLPLSAFLPILLLTSPTTEIYNLRTAVGIFADFVANVADN